MDEIHSLLDNPLILPQAKILISFWSQKAENQKFDIEENVMSEPVKMPGRHFLRRDYLHILFYIKFLLFCSFAPDEIKSLCEKNEDFPQKPMFFLFSHIFISSVISNNLYLSPLEINFPESYILLVHSTLPNCRFKIARKKKKYHIPDAASERV